MKKLLFTLVLFSLLVQSVVAIENSTANKTQAEISIVESRQIIQNLELEEMPTSFVSDKLIEAENYLQIINYIEITKNAYANPAEKEEARNYLKLIDTKNASYDKIVEYAQIIKKHADQTFLVYDLLTSTEERFKSEAQTNENIRDLLEKAKEDFYYDRISESEVSIREARQILENDKTILAEVKGVGSSAKSFIIKYWYYNLLGLILLILLILLIRRGARILGIRKKIEKMKNEEKILRGLIIKAQEERFKENKISGVVYNIKMKKYSERINEIKQQLPYLEKSLRKSNHQPLY